MAKRLTGKDLQAMAVAEQQRKDRAQGLPGGAVRRPAALPTNGHAAPLEPPETLCEPWEILGRAGFIHPTDFREGVWLNAEAGKWVRAHAAELGITDEASGRYWVGEIGEVFQIITCFRQSEDPESDRVFALGDFDLLLTAKSARVKIKLGVAASDRLSGEGFTRQAFDAFFSVVPTRLIESFSRLKRGLCEKSRRELEALPEAEELTQLIGFLTLTGLRGMLSLDELPEPPGMEAEETEAESPDPEPVEA